MVPLPYRFGWFLTCIFNKEEFIYRTFEDCIGLSILTIVPLISASLLGNTSVNGNSPKVYGYLSLFLYLVLVFLVSQVNLLLFMSQPTPKMITHAVFLIVVLERTIRFAVTVDVVLEDYNSCLPKTNNWVLKMFR